MNNIELQALRRLLFYTIPEAAALISGTSTRAWEHWESGQRPVPEDVAAQMVKLAGWRQNAINEILAERKKLEKNHRDPGQISLVYYNNSIDFMHNPQLWRPAQSVCAAFLAIDNRVRLVNFNLSAYTAWLNGRKDSQSLRAAWAAQIQ